MEAYFKTDGTVEIKAENISELLLLRRVMFEAEEDTYCAQCDTFVLPVVVNTKLTSQGVG